MQVTAVRIKDKGNERTITVFGNRGKNRKVLQVIKGPKTARSEVVAAVESAQQERLALDVN